jgi:hypothetical protein
MCTKVTAIVSWESLGAPAQQRMCPAFREHQASRVFMVTTRYALPLKSFIDASMAKPPHYGSSPPFNLPQDRWGEETYAREE